MKKTLKYSTPEIAKSNFYEALDKCLHSIIDGQGLGKYFEQMDEIRDVVAFARLNGYGQGLKRLAKTDIFAEAVGETEEITDTSITYEEK